MFDFTGKIIHSMVKYSGSWHDSRIAYASGLIFPKLRERMTPPSRVILGDSAFMTSDMHGKVVRGRKTSKTEGIPSNTHLSAIDLISQCVKPHERQSGERGIQIVKTAFSILCLLLTPSSRERKVLLKTGVHLIKERGLQAGLNQIKTVYANNGTDV